MTLALSDEIYEIVKAHKEISWSQVARKAIEEYAKKLALLEALTSESELTEDEIMMIDEKVKKGIYRHYLEKMDHATDH